MKVTDDEIHTLLSDINVTYNGQLELADYLQVSHSHTHLIALYCYSNMVRRRFLVRSFTKFSEKSTQTWMDKLNLTSICRFDKRRSVFVCRFCFCWTSSPLTPPRTDLVFFLIKKNAGLSYFFLDDVGYQIWSRNVLQIRPNGRTGRAKARERNA